MPQFGQAEEDIEYSSVPMVPAPPTDPGEDGTYNLEMSNDPHHSQDSLYFVSQRTVVQPVQS